MNGTCTLLKERFNKDVIYFACRHHIFELILRNVTEVAWPASNSPNPPIFKRFQSSWDKIDKTKYEVGIDDENVKTRLDEIKNEKLAFIKNQLQVRTKISLINVNII